MKRKTLLMIQGAVFASVICFGFALLPNGTPTGEFKRSEFRESDFSAFWKILAIYIVALLIVISITISWTDLHGTRNLSARLRYETIRNPDHFWFRFIVLSLGSVFTISRIFLDPTEACKTSNLDPDIGGDGVLVGLYVPMLLVTASLLFGHLTGLDTGIKELASIALMSKAAVFLWIACC
jgi:hypothetical protein